MNKDSNIYLADILGAIERIEGYLRGAEIEDFYNNLEKQDAVIRQFEIIGEAATSYHKLNPHNDDLPWLPMISMRNKLIHEYHGVDLDTVWKTAWVDLPAAKIKLQEVLQSRQ